jgi:hypothetical protein
LGNGTPKGSFQSLFLLSSRSAGTSKSIVLLGISISRRGVNEFLGNDFRATRRGRSSIKGRLIEEPY